jgi:UDP-N-acetylglucosamine 2-epimerase (non-hydrolysing)
MDEKGQKIKLCLVVGARPNFMKVSPIIDMIEHFNKTSHKEISYRLIHTGQHYDKSMSDDFFDQLQIPKPNNNLNCVGSSQSELTANIMVEFEKELTSNRPDLVIVVGDVTSTMACSIVTKKLNIKLAHVEAGIRSLDREMPEEINRLITDSISDYFFTTSRHANENLIKENINPSKIFFVGNTMIDCLIKNLHRSNKPSFLDNSKDYFLMTLHRPSNVDDLGKLSQILEHIDKSVGNHKVIFPVHHRTKLKLQSLNINLQNVEVIDPQGYLEFIYLIKNSLGVITDSGGITEETTYLNIPCITLRDSTERPETVTIGTNELIGDDLGKLTSCINRILIGEWKKGGIPELWDGSSSKRIINELITLI